MSLHRSQIPVKNAGCQPLFDAARRGSITLLYSTRDTQHNNAVVLKSYLEEGLTAKKG
jgi:uncharacterized protein YeaO (DUF488 family)